jgi:hypothetical protein
MAYTQYIVLFRGDDTDFAGNQEIKIKLETKMSLEGVSAHFKFLDFEQDFDTIPEDKELRLVFPANVTKQFPIGSMDAELYLVDKRRKRRTIANRIHIVVTQSVAEAYDNTDPQAITVSISNSGITWNSITGKPKVYPPSQHRHTENEIDGLDDTIQSISDHINNKNNPHEVTAAQVGAYTKSEVDNKLASIKVETDTTVIEGSSNPVSGGAVYTALEQGLAKKADKTPSGFLKLEAYAGVYGNDYVYVDDGQHLIIENTNSEKWYLMNFGDTQKFQETCFLSFTGSEFERCIFLGNDCWYAAPKNNGGYSALSLSVIASACNITLKVGRMYKLTKWSIKVPEENLSVPPGWIGTTLYFELSEA